MGTPYAGTYGCCFDHGVSPPGHLAHNYRSDKRQHGTLTPLCTLNPDFSSHPRMLSTGNCCLSEQMANELSAKFAQAHWVKFEDRPVFCDAPVTTRGVPHNLTPGIHKCLNDYLDALETLRKHAGREDAPTVDSFTCLSFSPWSQALAPVIEATADLSMRLCVRDPSLLSVQSGKAYLPDSTPEEEAIVREPLFRRPCQARCVQPSHLHQFVLCTCAHVPMCPCAQHSQYQRQPICHIL